MSFSKKQPASFNHLFIVIEIELGMESKRNRDHRWRKQTPTPPLLLLENIFFYNYAVGAKFCG